MKDHSLWVVFLCLKSGLYKSYYKSKNKYAPSAILGGLRLMGTWANQDMFLADLISALRHSASRGTTWQYGVCSTCKCKLAAPKEIPVTPTGILYVDLEQKTHMLSLTLLVNVDVDLNCVHSTSGAYKKQKGVMLRNGRQVRSELKLHVHPVTARQHVGQIGPDRLGRS